MTTAGGASHAALMDAVYRHQRHVYDLTRYCYLLGRDQLIAELDPPPDGTVLEIACGTGRNLVAAARRYAAAKFFGFDISAEMLKTAERSVAASPDAGRIALSSGNALSFNPRPAFARETFDRIFFSYSLSMIPGWQAALVHAMSMLAPGGRLLIVDFGQCQGLPRWFRRGLFRWLDLFHVTPRADLETFIRALASSRHAEMRFQPLHRGYAWRATLILPEQG